MDKLSIYEIVSKLVGETIPVGETHTDNKRFENLNTTIELVERLLYDIKYVSQYKDNQEYSMSLIGTTADDFLKETYRELFDDFEKERLDG